MRNRLQILLLLLLAGTRLSAATTLKGVVRFETGAGTIAKGVQIAADGANAVVSDSAGMFTLQFPHKEPGETVEVLVSQEKWAVVNFSQMQLALPKDPGAARLTVVICKKDDREVWVRLYYTGTLRASANEIYEVKLQKLRAENKATQAAMADLRSQLDRANDAAIHIAGELTKAQTTKSSDLRTRALTLFLAGKVDEALAMLNQETSHLQHEIADQHMLLAEMYASKFQFDEAEKAYRMAAQIEPDDFKINSTFARFSQEQNHLTEAEAAYTRTLELAKRSGKNEDIATTSQNLGALYAAQHKLEKASESFSAALVIRRKLERRDWPKYSPEVAKTLTFLGNVSRDRNRIPDARKFYEEALAIYRKLEKAHTGAYSLDYATTLRDLGNLFMKQNRMEDARSSYESALQIERRLALAGDNPTSLLRVAKTDNNLGILYRDLNRMAESRTSFLEALDIFRKLAKKNPSRYLDYVGGALNNLGLLDQQENHLETAGKEFTEALDIRHKLANENPAAYQSQVMQTLNNLASLDLTA